MLYKKCQVRETMTKMFPPQRQCILNPEYFCLVNTWLTDIIKKMDRSTLLQNYFPNCIYEILVCLFNTLSISYVLLPLCQNCQIVR